jgi:RNA polymerase sigma-70 factor, ECF subfamily
MDDDEELMRQTRNGSREAFEAIFDRYRAPVWRFFRRRIAEPARAEELAQDTFVAVLQNAARYEARGAFRSYLFAVAYNLVLAERRKRGAGFPDPIEPDSLHASSPDADAAIWVRRALASLDPDDREMLMLREYDQLSYQDIAGVCRLPLNTVRTRLFRARLALKAALVPERGPRHEHV